MASIIYKGRTALDNYFAVKIPYYTGSHIRSFNNSGFSLGSSQTSSAFIFCVWIRTTTTREQCFLNRSGWYGSSQQSFPFRSFIGATGSIYGGLDSGTDFVYDYTIPATGNNLNDGNWHHIGFSYKAATYFRIFVDGYVSLNASITTTIHNLRSDIDWRVGEFDYYDGGPTPINYVGDMAYPVWGMGRDTESIITSAYLLKP